MAEVEHHANIVTLGLAGDADGVAQAVDVKPGVRVEHNLYAVGLGFVGDFLHERDGLFVGVVALIALHVQLEKCVTTLEMG